MHHPDLGAAEYTSDVFRSAYRRLARTDGFKGSSPRLGSG
jgi:hypothetical protein